MDSTSVSLLLRVRNPDDRSSWERFVDLYTPMIYRWACRIGLPKNEAADLVQDVFLKVLKQMPSFEYDRGKSFRAWLKTITLNQTRDFLRHRSQRPVPDPLNGSFVPVDPDGVEFLSDQEYNSLVTRQALHCMQSEFEETTWQACWQSVVDGKSAAEISRDLKITQNAVYLAKSRVLRKLRLEFDGLLD